MCANYVERIPKAHILEARERDKHAQADMLVLGCVTNRTSCKVQTTKCNMSIGVINIRIQ